MGEVAGRTLRGYATVKRHRDVFVKVNAPVDEGIAEVVRLLSRIPGLETIESCQGDPQQRRRPAFVLFRLGGWAELSQFLGLISPQLVDPHETVSVSIEAFNGGRPIGRIAFRSEATPRVEGVLRRAVRVYA